MVAPTSSGSVYAANPPLPTYPETVANTAEKTAFIGLAIIGTIAVVSACVLFASPQMFVVALVITAFAALCLLSNDESGLIVVRETPYRTWLPIFGSNEVFQWLLFPDTPIRRLLPIL